MSAISTGRNEAILSCRGEKYRINLWKSISQSRQEERVPLGSPLFLQLSADALAVCASKLNYYRAKLERSSEERHRVWAERFATLHEKCIAALNEQAEAKWRVAERMGAA